MKPAMICVAIQRANNRGYYIVAIQTLVLK